MAVLTKPGNLRLGSTETKSIPTAGNVNISNRRKEEGNILFTDALNTFYLRLYGVRHMVMHQTYSERGNPLPPYRLLLLISSKGSFICIIPETG